MNKKILFGISVVILVLIAVIIAGFMGQQPERSPNQAFSIFDSENDFIFAEDNEANIGVSLSPVDIVKVEAMNDKKNFIVTVETMEPLPNKANAPSYPDCYVCVIDVMADNDGSKFVEANIIIDDLYGWDFWVGYVTEDNEKISYNVDGKQLTFTFPLDMIYWKGTPELMSFRVYFGYENDGRIYDMIPNQEWGENKYQEYELWKDSGPNPTSTPTPTPTPTPSPTATPTPTPTPTPAPIGYSSSTPAPANMSLDIEFQWLSDIDTLTLDDCKARVTLLEFIRGEEAWQRIEEANMFNEPPDSGTEYILFKIRFEYLEGPTAHTIFHTYGLHFDVISETGVKYERRSVVTPESDLSLSLYPGGSHEGWGAYQVAINDTQPLLVFERNYDGSGGIWFKFY